jgi:hypothetical protein
LLATFLPEQGVEHVCVLQAGQWKHKKRSPMRAKAEGIVQLVGAELNLGVDLVAPQALRAQEKRFEAITGGTPEGVMNGGHPFIPKTWRDAVLVAWWGLPE